MGTSYPKDVRDQAREKWVSGDANISAIAHLFGIQRGTILRWRAEEDWDGLRNEAEQESHAREVETLVQKRQAFTANCLQLWAFLHAQMFLRAKRYGTDKKMPMDEAIDMAKVLAAVETGYFMALGVDPKLEAKMAVDTSPRRVMVEYDPQPGVFDYARSNDSGNGAGNDEDADPELGGA